MSLRVISPSARRFLELSPSWTLRHDATVSPRYALVLVYSPRVTGRATRVKNIAVDVEPFVRSLLTSGSTDYGASRSCCACAPLVGVKMEYQDTCRTLLSSRKITGSRLVPRQAGQTSCTGRRSDIRQDEVAMVSCTGYRHGQYIYGLIGACRSDLLGTAIASGGSPCCARRLRAVCSPRYRRVLGRHRRSR